MITQLRSTDDKSPVLTRRFPLHPVFLLAEYRAIFVSVGFLVFSYSSPVRSCRAELKHDKIIAVGWGG
mgnify:FL=1